jgi:hypothetical protein
MTGSVESQVQALDEFDTYVVVNEALIPNYGERWRNEEAIATALWNRAWAFHAYVWMNSKRRLGPF